MSFLDCSSITIISFKFTSKNTLAFLKVNAWIDLSFPPWFRPHSLCRSEWLDKGIRNKNKHIHQPEKSGILRFLPTLPSIFSPPQSYIGLGGWRKWLLLRSSRWRLQVALDFQFPFLGSLVWPLPIFHILNMIISAMLFAEEDSGRINFLSSSTAENFRKKSWTPCAFSFF